MSYNNRPPSTGYGVPQAPPLDNNYGTSYYNNPAPVYLYRGSNISYHHQNIEHINHISGYEDDIYLLVKLGEAAIIIFIIFAVVAVLYMLINCCISISARNK